jgi:hypothetical protein
MVHSEAVNPHMLYDVNARDLPALRRLAETRLPRVQGASDALAACLAEAESKTARVSEKTEAFWRGRKEVLDALLSIYADAGKGEEELDEEGTGRREMYFARAKDAWEVLLRDALIKINGEIIGPFVLGRLSAGSYRSVLTEARRGPAVYSRPSPGSMACPSRQAGGWRCFR